MDQASLISSHPRITGWMAVFWVIMLSPTWFLFSFFFFNFILLFKLYIIVLVLPNIKMNPPQVTEWASQVALVIKNRLPTQETQKMRVQSLCQEIPWRRKWQPAPQTTTVNIFLASGNPWRKEMIMVDCFCSWKRLWTLFPNKKVELICCCCCC